MCKLNKSSCLVYELCLHSWCHSKMQKCQKISFKHMSGLYQQKPRRNQGKSEASCPLDTAAPSSTTAFQGRMHLQHWIHDIEFEAISFCQPVLGYFAEEMGHSIQWKPICPGFRLWKKCLLLYREKYSKQWIKNLCRLKLASEKGVLSFVPQKESTSEPHLVPRLAQARLKSLTFCGCLFSSMDP